MKKKDNKNSIILKIIIILFIILIVMIGLLKYFNNTNKNNISSINIMEKENTIKDIIENSGSKHISETRKKTVKVSVIFKYDLYDEDGKSNQTFFENIIKKIVMLEQDNFEIEDSIKKILVSVLYNKNTQQYIYTINGISNYFNNTDGDIYVKLKDIKIIERTPQLIVASEELMRLSLYRMEYSDSNLGNGVELKDGYESYKENSIKAKKVGGKINNIIFTEKYEEKIYKDISVGTSLSQIEKILGKSPFGSIRDGYLGYRGEKIYTFFYENEISAHGYVYSEDKNFNYYLDEYMLSGDLDTFAKKVRVNWPNCNLYEYDETEKDLHVTYPAYGIEINIKNNNPKGIIIYNNCYISKTIERYIKENKITLKNEDYIYITEQNRVNRL